MRIRWSIVIFCALPMLFGLSGCRHSQHLEQADAVIRVHGRVLDASQLPKRIPVSWAAVTVERLLGDPSSARTTYTRTNRHGAFELEIPLYHARESNWGGIIWAEALGYGESSVLCCGTSLDPSSCQLDACTPGTTAYVEIGLWKSSPIDVSPRVMWGTLGGKLYPYVTAILAASILLGLEMSRPRLARDADSTHSPGIRSGLRGARFISLLQGTVALALVTVAIRAPWYEWILHREAAIYHQNGQPILELSNIWGPPSYAGHRAFMAVEYIRKPVPSQDIVNICVQSCFVAIVLCLILWMTMLYEALKLRGRRGRAILITIFAGLVLCVGTVFAIGPWAILEEGLLMPLGATYKLGGGYTAALYRIRAEGPVTLLAGLGVAIIAISLWPPENKKMPDVLEQ